MSEQVKKKRKKKSVSKIVKNVKSLGWSIPVIEREDGWETIKEVDIDPSHGLAMTKVNVKAPPGEMFRLRTETLQGKSHDATVWSLKSNGIPKEESLEGHEFGGHEIKKVKLQRLEGCNGEADFEFVMH